MFYFGPQAEALDNNDLWNNNNLWQLSKTINIINQVQLS